MSEGLNQIQEFLRGLSLKQKLLLAGGAAAVALTLWFFVTLLDKGKYVTLYSGLKPQDAQSLGSRLAAKNIPYQISTDGASVLVPTENLDAARLETASQGLPRNARLGFELFDTPNWAGSDFSEKVNYQRALEGELERTLQTLAEVEAVRVHLVMPRESLFSEQEHEAKAAVIVKTRGGTLSREAQQAIPQLVASAVDRLRPDNVTVVDAETATPFLPRRGPGGRVSFDSDEELAAAAVHAIEPVVGADHVRASVHVDYDLSTSEDTSEVYDPKASAVLTQQHSEELAGGANPAGVPGTASKAPGSAAPTPTVLATLDNQTSKTDSTTYAVSKNTRHVTQPAGRVRRITASVLVDDAIEHEAGKWQEHERPAQAYDRRNDGDRKTRARRHRSRRSARRPARGRKPFLPERARRNALGAWEVGQNTTARSAVGGSACVTSASHCCSWLCMRWCCVR